MTVNNSTACQDDPWQGKPYIQFGTETDLGRRCRALTAEHRELSERANELGKERYEVAAIPSDLQHSRLARIDQERARIETKLARVNIALHAASRELAAGIVRVPGTENL